MDLHDLQPGFCALDDADRAPADPELRRQEFTEFLVGATLQRGRVDPDPEGVLDPADNAAVGGIGHRPYREATRFGHGEMLCARGSGCQGRRVSLAAPRAKMRDLLALRVFATQLPGPPSVGDRPRIWAPEGWPLGYFYS